MNEQTSIQPADAVTTEARSRRGRRTARPPEPKVPVRVTKSATVEKLLSRTRGASIDELMKATGWQAHSVRGFIAGTLKKRAGKEVISEATEKGRIYRLVDAVA